MSRGIYIHKKGCKRPPRTKEWRDNLSKSLKGRKVWNKGKKNCYTPEMIKRMSEAHKGQVAWNKGLEGSCPHTEEWKKKMSKIIKKLGNTPPNWKGKKRSPESVEKSAMNRRGVKRPQTTGANNPLWKGGITPLHIAIRTSLENKQWVRGVFKRDNYTCQECFIRGCELEAHHKKPFAIILREFLAEYSQFSPIEDKETLVRLALTYKPFWNIANGKTLCEECHNRTKVYINGAAAQ